MGTYSKYYETARQNPDAFWADAAKAIDWDTPFETVVDDRKAPFYRWFAGGRLNTCYNCLDRHIEAGNGDVTALIYDSPVTNTKREYTYTQLRDEVAKCAGVIAGLGISQGDRVIIYMPMVPEAAIAMLACARLGAIHSVVFGGFAAHELATRIEDAAADLVISASCGIEPKGVIPYKPLLDQAIVESSHKPKHCLILQRPQEQAAMVQGRDLDWTQSMAAAQPHACVSVAATDPLYILYTSGTTGKPKGIVRDNGGHAVGLMWSMKNIYDCEAGDVYWAASDVGWVVGHSYIVYAPLLAGCTTVVYEGKPVGTPDPGAFWRVISEHKVKCMFTAPTAMRAIRQQDPTGEYLKKHDLSCLKSQFLAGERCDPDTLVWVEKALNVPVIDHWWQTETGWSITANCLGIEHVAVKPGSSTLPTPAWSLAVLDAEGKPVAPGEVGSICAKLPMAPGSFPTIWGAEERYFEAYLAPFPGYYMTGDAGYIDEDGYVFVMSRTDDIINVAGHRLSTGAMEEVLATHPEVAECAVIGVHDEMKGQLPLGFLVLNANSQADKQTVIQDVIMRVRTQIGPVAAFKSACVVDRLPKTRSGKILRGTMRKIADGEEYRVPPTIDDPAILDEIKTDLQELGYA